MSNSLIVGLGNPGKQYEGTRHNIGFMVLDKLADMEQLSWKSDFKGEYCVFNVGGSKCYLLKPLTFMNLSGESVGQLASFFKIPQENVTVVHDELDIEYGKLKYKRGGSAGGHNGISSIISHLGQNFLHLKMGVAGLSRAQIRGNTASYVLGNFTPQERETLSDFIDKGAESLLYLLNNGMLKTMEVYNKN